MTPLVRLLSPRLGGPLSLEIFPVRVFEGSNVTLGGELRERKTGFPLARRVITVYLRRAEEGWRHLGNVSTDLAGRYLLRFNTSGLPLGTTKSRPNGVAILGTVTPRRWPSWQWSPIPKGELFINPSAYCSLVATIVKT